MMQLEIRHARDLSWTWPKGDEWGFDHPLREFDGLRDLILAHTFKRKAILQAGGCCGMYPRLWANDFEKIYTFEPDATNFVCLVANTVDVADRVFAMRAALSRIAGSCSLTGGEEFNVGMHRICAGTDIPTIRIDSLYFNELDVIQLDCEGHERHVIDGARGTIATHSPTISVEAPSNDLKKLLNELGYSEVGRTGDMPDVVYKKAML